MNDSLKKYEGDDISDELLIYLRRNFHTVEHQLSFMDKTMKMILIDGKSYFLDRNKKFLVNKLYNITSDKFDITEKVARRTIKKFLDGISN